jgi:glucose/arabinose dehydrogenase
LAFGPDGVLYFARPATGEILRLVPDGKGLFSPPQVFAAKLPEPPNGLAYDPVDRAWFVSADTTITRLRDRDGDGAADDQQVIVRDLPGGTGGWLGNVRIGPDRRLYVTKASSCDACTESDPRRGVLLSFALDGGDMRIVARGLRDAYDFDWTPADGKLYIVDNERPTLPAELNALPDQIPPSGVDFGWPYCDSRGQPVAGIDVNACANTIPSIQIFAPGSHPTGMMFYRGEAFPDFHGKLLVLLSGSWNTPTISGYEIMIVSFADGQPGPPQRLLPNSQRVTSDAAQGMTSFYPYHMTAIAISPEGWIYVSIAEGRIYRFRPAVP